MHALFEHAFRLAIADDAAALIGEGLAIKGWGLRVPPDGRSVRAFASTLLAALDANSRTSSRRLSSAPAADHASHDADNPIVEVLTARERDVLQLMARNRTEAVALAREVGYLPR